MIYAARFEVMNSLLGFLTENCCQGAVERCAPAICMHIHVSVANLEHAGGFYSALFEMKPAVFKHDTRNG
ncbi:MAG: hypothetical protein WAN49_17765, partial [Pseudolabrys sp.]